ncbi:MAG: glycine cleavage system protein R [Desulfomicrobium sp.]
MNKFVLSVIGKDKPGILAKISTILFTHGCNIEDVSQTILQTEFASIFIVLNPDAHPLGEIGRSLNEALADMELSAHLRPMAAQVQVPATDTQPFVITTKGVDKSGTIAAVTGAIASLACNVVHFRAIITQDEGVDEMIMIFEVDVPAGVEHRHLRRVMQETCSGFGLDVSVQHRDIFETIHRV